MYLSEKKKNESKSRRKKREHIFWGQVWSVFLLTYSVTLLSTTVTIPLRYLLPRMMKLFELGTRNAEDRPNVDYSARHHPRSAGNSLTLVQHSGHVDPCVSPHGILRMDSEHVIPRGSVVPARQYKSPLPA